MVPMPMAVFLAVLAVLVTACSSSPSRDRAADVPPPPQLLWSGDLEVPAGCDVTPGAVYRADFVVGSDGAVEDVLPGEGPPCARDALERWVRTLRYEPGAASGPAAVDWMVVVARR